MSRLFLPLSLLLTALLMLSACQVDPEKSPAFAQMQEKLKKLDDDQKKLQHGVEAVSFEMDELGNTVKALKKATPQAGASPELAAALDRIAKLEDKVKALSEPAPKKAAAPSGDEAPAADGGKPAAKSAHETAAPKASSSKSAKSTAKPAAKTGAASASENAGTSSETPRKGFYYQVKPGDSLQSVAEANGISTADLSKANHLPASAALYPGQPIYIPGK